MPPAPKLVADIPTPAAAVTAEKDSRKASIVFISRSREEQGVGAMLGVANRRHSICMYNHLQPLSSRFGLLGRGQKRASSVNGKPEQFSIGLRRCSRLVPATEKSCIICG
jgi:hypothetical protein